MPAPQIEIVPVRQGLRDDATTELAVLVRIVPPAPDISFVRPPINLGLALDRSGSMSGGGKLRHAREAAAFAVEQLLPTDRVSVTIFDDVVETIVPSTPATDKARIVARIRAVEPGGSTALFDAWAAAARQVETTLNGEGLNRVLLLSDGLANVGLSSPSAIAEQVRAARQRGVTTTTLGVGDDYNEDLMEGMARAGDGNYYFVETSRQLADLFQTELHGLMATAGREVELALEPRNGAAVVEVLNELERTGEGHLRLANLVVGMPLEVVLKLTVPAAAVVTEVLRVRLGWTEAGCAERQTAAGALILPAVPSTLWDELPRNEQVVECMSLLEVQRLKVRAAASAVVGDTATTLALLGRSRILYECLPASATLAAELEDLQAMETDLADENLARLSKRAKWGSYRRSRSRPQTPPPADSADEPTAK